MLSALLNNAFFSNELVPGYRSPPSNVYVVTAVSTVFFACLQIILYYTGKFIYPAYFQKLDRIGKINYNSRVVSNFHAIAIALWSVRCEFLNNFFAQIYLYVTIPEFYQQNSVLYASEDISVSFGFSTGYFLVDLYLVISTYPALGDMSMVLHHVFGIGAQIVANVYICSMHVTNNRAGGVATFMLSL